MKNMSPKSSIAAMKFNALAAYIFLAMGVLFATAIMIAGSLESAVSEIAGLLVSLSGAFVLSRAMTPAFARQRR